MAQKHKTASLAKSANRTNRLWQAWYYISLIIGAWAFFIVLTNSPCFWEDSARCSGTNESDIFVTASAAFANAIFARWKYRGLVMYKFSLWTGWRGDRTLPPSFALFIMMAAVFIGEVLPVVISILVGNFGAYGSKEPIIKTLPDFGLVLIIYSILGTLFWALYRYVNVRIVAVFAFALTFLLERYVYWHPEGEISVANTISIGVILNGIIVYFLVLVMPYLIFQRIRNRPGKDVIKKMLVVILALNVVGLGFTYAYLVSTSWYEKDHVNLIRPGESSRSTYSELSMITPYVNESDISRIGPFGTDENNPWGFKHTGIDFFTVNDTIPFRAVAGGTIEMVSTSKENERQGRHTGLCINHNPFLICYNFETFSVDGQRQRENIYVQNGDKVEQGDLIGNLVYGGEGAHVDLGVLKMGGSGERICPGPYFTEDALSSILRLIHKDHPEWQMCYQ